ncbi:MAG: pyridoxamine 5'-phosphate oxidase family protein [Promethearchaeota archaeon]
MRKYNLRRKEKAITDENEIFGILKRNLIFTIAICKENEPYLVTMNYAFDKKNMCFYFHCAYQGKKIDFLRANPTVWGQIIEDKGYIKGKCDYSYISIHFSGHVEFIEDITSKQNILSFMIEQFEENPEPVRKQYINNDSLKTVCVGKIAINELTGKKEI